MEKKYTHTTHSTNTSNPPPPLSPQVSGTGGAHGGTVDSGAAARDTGAYGAGGFDDHTLHAKLSTTPVC